jgi:cold shock CspA family protein
VSKQRWRNKDAKKLVQQIEAAGGAVEVTANGHLLVTGPAGTATIPSDYSYTKAMAITRANLARETGIVLPRTGNAGPRGAAYHRRTFDPPRLGRQEGTITRWFDRDDYGFVTGEDGGTYFISKSALTPHQLDRLGVGVRVCFSGDSEVWPGGRYPHARALRVLDAA